MLNNYVIRACISASIVAIVVFLVRRNTKPVEEIIDGKQVLKHGRAFKILLIVLWIGWLLILAAVVFIPKNKPSDWIIAGSIVVILLALLTLLHQEVFGTRITFDETGIESHRVLRRDRKIAWNEIVSLQFYGGTYVCKTKHDGSLHISPHMNGAKALISELERRGVRRF